MKWTEADYKRWIEEAKSTQPEIRQHTKSALFGQQWSHATADEMRNCCREICSREMEESFWKAFTANKAEVILTKEAVMMIEMMHGGIPKGWGEPMKRKGLWAWLSISTPKNGDEFLHRDMFKLLPVSSYYCSWTNNAGTRRDWIGDPVKFGMDVEAPIVDDHPEFRILDDIDRGKWGL